MCSEESEEKKAEKKCCNPENFQIMLDMMDKFFKRESKFDCSAIMTAMKNQSCCSLKGENTKTGCC